MIEFDKRYLAKCSSLLSNAKDRLDAGQHVKARNVLIALESMNGQDPVLAYPQLQLRILNLLASAERHLRLMESAVARLQRCLEICDVFGCDKGESLITLAAVYMDLNNFEEAKGFCEEAMEQFIALNNKDRTSTYGRLIATCCYNIGQCCLELGKPGKAAQSFSSGTMYLRRMVVSPDDALLKLLEKAYKESLQEARHIESKNKQEVATEQPMLKNLYGSTMKGLPMKSNPNIIQFKTHQDQSVSTKQNNQPEDRPKFHKKHLSANQTKLSYFAGADNKAQVVNYMPIRHLNKNSQTEIRVKERSTEIRNLTPLVESWKDSADPDISIHSSRTSINTSKQTNNSMRALNVAANMSKPMKKLSSVTLAHKRPSSALTNPQKDSKKYLINHNISSRKIKPHPNDASSRKPSGKVKVVNQSASQQLEPEDSRRDPAELSQVTEKMHLKTDESKEIIEGGSKSHKNSVITSNELKYMKGKSASKIQKAWRNYQYSESRQIKHFTKSHPKAVWISTSFLKVRKERVNGHRLIPCKIMVYHSKLEYLVSLLQTPFKRQTAFLQVHKSFNILGELDKIRLDSYGKAFYCNETDEDKKQKRIGERDKIVPINSGNTDVPSFQSSNTVQAYPSVDTIRKQEESNDKRELLELKNELKEQVKQMEVTRKQLESLMVSFKENQNSGIQLSQSFAAVQPQKELERPSNMQSQQSIRKLEEKISKDMRPIDLIRILPGTATLTIEQTSFKIPSKKKIITKRKSSQLIKTFSQESSKVSDDNTKNIESNPVHLINQDISFSKKNGPEILKVQKESDLPLILEEKISKTVDVNPRVSFMDNPIYDEQLEGIADEFIAEIAEAMIDKFLLDAAYINSARDSKDLNKPDESCAERESLLANMAEEFMEQIGEDLVQILAAEASYEQENRSESQSLNSDNDPTEKSGILQIKESEREIDLPNDDSQVKEASADSSSKNSKGEIKTDVKIAILTSNFTLAPNKNVEEEDSNLDVIEEKRSITSNTSSSKDSDSQEIDELHFSQPKARNSLKHHDSRKLSAQFGPSDLLPRMVNPEPSKPPYPAHLAHSISFGIERHDPLQHADVKIKEVKPPADLPDDKKAELDNSVTSADQVQDKIGHLHTPKKYEQETSRSCYSLESHNPQADNYQEVRPPSNIQVTKDYFEHPQKSNNGERRPNPMQAVRDLIEIEAQIPPADEIYRQIEQLQIYKTGLYVRHFNIDARDISEELIEQAEDFFETQHPVLVCFQLDDNMSFYAKAKERMDRQNFQNARNYMIQNSFWRNIVARPVYEVLEKQLTTLSNPAPAHSKVILSPFQQGLKAMMISRNTQIEHDQEISPKKLPTEDDAMNNKGCILETAQYLYSFICSKIGENSKTEEQKAKDSSNQNVTIKVNPSARSISNHRQTVAELENLYRENMQKSIGKIFECMVIYFEQKKQISSGSFKNHCERMIIKLNNKIKILLEAENSKKRKKDKPEIQGLEKNESTMPSALEQANEKDLRVFTSNKKYLTRTLDKPLYQLPILKTFSVQNSGGDRFSIKIRITPTSPQQFYIVETWSVSDNFLEARAFAETIFDTDLIIDSSKSEKMNRVVSMLVRSLVFEQNFNLAVKYNEGVPDFNLELGIKRRENLEHDPLVSSLY